MLQHVVSVTPAVAGVLHAAACGIGDACCSRYCCLPHQVPQPEPRGHPAARRPHHQGEGPAATDQILHRQGEGPAEGEGEGTAEADEILQHAAEGGPPWS